jgi:hypothetical protein
LEKVSSKITCCASRRKTRAWISRPVFWPWPGWSARNTAVFGIGGTAAADGAGPDGCLSSVNTAGEEVTEALEPIWQANCHRISRADFWALAGKLALESADPTDSMATMIECVKAPPCRLF